MHTPVNACVLQETVNRATFKGSSEDAPDQDAEEAAEPAPKPAKKARTQKAEKDTEPKQSKNKKKGGVNLMSKAKSVIAACAPLQITLNHTLDSLTPDLRTKLPGYGISEPACMLRSCVFCTGKTCLAFPAQARLRIAAVAVSGLAFGVLNE